jgi:hypothetical protein
MRWGPESLGTIAAQHWRYTLRSRGDQSSITQYYPDGAGESQARAESDRLLEFGRLGRSPEKPIRTIVGDSAANQLRERTTVRPSYVCGICARVNLRQASECSSLGQKSLRTIESLSHNMLFGAKFDRMATPRAEDQTG